MRARRGVSFSGDDSRRCGDGFCGGDFRGGDFRGGGDDENKGDDECGAAGPHASSSSATNVSKLHPRLSLCERFLGVTVRTGPRVAREAGSSPSGVMTLVESASTWLFEALTSNSLNRRVRHVEYCVVVVGVS